MPWSTPTIVFLIVSALRGVNSGSLAEAASAEFLRRALMPPAAVAIVMGPPAVHWPSAAELASPVSAPPAPSSTPLASQASETEARAKAADSGDPLKEKTAELSESEWRKRMAVAREQLESDRLLAEAMQGRVNGLTTDVMNRDDPAQRAELVKQKARATAELDRLTRQIDADTRAIASIEDEARRKGIPPGWIR